MKPSVEIREIPVTINTRRVQSLMDARVIYSGDVSGKHYEWTQAGAIVDVDQEDVPALLAKRRGKKPCCGEQAHPIFQLVQ